MSEIKTLDYSGSSVGTGAYVALGTVTSIHTSKLLISDSSGKVLKIAADNGAVTPAVAASMIDQTITYTAAQPGSFGNSISVEIDDPGVPGSSLSVAVSDGAITISLASGAAVAAAKVIQDLTYTAVTAGAAGNNITIAYLDPGGNNQALSVGVVSSAITVHLATGAGGAITSTATQIKAAIDGSSPAHALVSVVISGTGSTVEIAQVATHLLGGKDDTPTSKASDVISALASNAAARALVTAASSAPTTVLTTLTQTSLTGGTDAVKAIVDLFQVPVDQTMIIPLPSIDTLPIGSQLYLRAISATANSGFNATTLIS